jgi:hypothetical protein
MSIADGMLLFSGVASAAADWVFRIFRVNPQLRIG